MEEFSTIEKVQGLFAKKPKEPAEYCLVYSTYPTSAIVLGGAGTKMTESVDQAYGGYLVRIHEDGLDLCPLSKVHKNNGISSPSKMKLANAPVRSIGKDEIVRFKNKPGNGILPHVRTVTMETKDGRTYVWQVNRKEGALPYHQSGYEALAQFGKSL